MIKKSRKSAYLSVVVMALAVTTHAAAWAANVPRPFLRADIDGDGKKDEFFRIFMPDKRVEIGVILANNKEKYIKIYDDNIKAYREASFGVSKRKPFLEKIKVGCEESCPNYRLEAISILSKSASPELVSISYNFSAKVICVDANGEVVEVWYSD